MTGLCYLDHNAGTPVRPEVAAAMLAALEQGGNPSSVHAAGRAARKLVEEARARVAALVGAQPDGVVFTSGGTEANALALRGAGRASVLVSAVEHASVRAAVAEADILPVDGEGVVDLAALERWLAARSGPALVSVMLANNETGVIQPVAEVAAIAHRHGALVHCDAVQAVGRIPVSLSALTVDFVTLSAHKMGAASGIGALVLADPEVSMAPILLGGGQERRRRGGTENLAGIVGFGVAAGLVEDEMRDGAVQAEMRRLRDGLEAQALACVPAARVLGAGAPRVGNTACLALPGVPSQTQVMALDLAGVMVSAGAACSSGKVSSSAVLAAMGVAPELAGAAIRVSLGRGNGEDDVRRFIAAWSALARRKGLKTEGAACAA